MDGRGRQELVRDPRNGGVAVVQIEDKEGAAKGTRSTLHGTHGGTVATRTGDRALEQTRRISSNRRSAATPRTTSSSAALTAGRRMTLIHRTIRTGSNPAPPIRGHMGTPTGTAISPRISTGPTTVTAITIGGTDMDFPSMKPCASASKPC